MKVLTFITDIDTQSGGPSRSVPLLVKGIAELGVDITLLTLRSDQMNTLQLEGSNAKLHILDKFSTVNVENLVVSEGYDIVQIQSIWNPLYHKLVKIAQKHGIPYVITPRGMLEPWSLSQKKLKKQLAMLLYQKYDLNNSSCIYTTAAMEAQHVRNLGIVAPCSVVPNGIEIDGYPCRNTIDRVQKQVLFLSRIHKKKGIELLVKAWSKLRDDFECWSLRIVGNGDENYIAELNALVDRLGCRDCISILPPVFGLDKVDLYQSSSLFVLPSYSENFGMAIAEALSCGVPVITTTNCPWKILNETHTGWCIDLSLQNLENALRNAMSMDAQDLFEMGQRASKLIDANFNYRNVALKTKQLYQWIIEGGDKPDFVI